MSMLIPGDPTGRLWENTERASSLLASRPGYPWRVETVLLYVLGILIVAIGFVVSIGLHELGHLSFAKLFKVRVGQYMIGFGPTLFSRTKGETEYGIKAIPLGGYISMAGMYPPAKPGEPARMSGTDTFAVQGDEQQGSNRGRAASTGIMQTLVQDARTASEEAVPVDDENRSFYRLPIWKRIVIMLAGPFMNLVIAVVLFAVVLCGFGIQSVSTTIGSVSTCVVAATSTLQKCTDETPKAPGALAGIRPGDTIVSIDGTPIDSWAQATAIIQKSPNQQLTIVVNRDGTKKTLTATPQLTERYRYNADGSVKKDSSGNSLTETVGMLGITAAYELQRQPVTAVLPAVGKNIAQVTHVILNLPQRLIDVAKAAFGSEKRDPNGPISVVGIGRMAGEVTSVNTVPFVDRMSYLVGLIGSVNVALLVLNLVPLLPLDGGHVAGALWEGIRRFFAKLFGRRDPGPVDIAKLVPLTLVVVLVLGAMSVLLMYADIVKPITVF
jgi:membrane-associated protease RseP (regulator of RpoE activity)